MEHIPQHMLCFVHEEPLLCACLALCAMSLDVLSGLGRGEGIVVLALVPLGCVRDHCV